MLRIIDHPHDLGMTGRAGADLAIGRIGRMSARITGCRVPDTLGFPEQAFHAPETAHAEEDLLHHLRPLDLQGPARHEMMAGRGDGRGAAGQGLVGRDDGRIGGGLGHGGFLARVCRQNRHSRRDCQSRNCRCPQACSCRPLQLGRPQLIEVTCSSPRDAYSPRSSR